MSATISQAGLESLLNVSEAFDDTKVRLLETLVNCMLTGDPNETRLADEMLSRLKANEQSWRIVGTILQSSEDVNTRFFALSILEECIQRRWNILTEEQKNGVKQYITDLTIKLSADGGNQSAKFIQTKVNKILVQVLKHEWPSNWPSFIPDLCAAARTNQGLCESSLKILSLLSEEVFDFGRDQLTSNRMMVMMTSLNEQFQQIYDLCMFVIQNSATSPDTISQSLLTTTLQCLANYLKWIPFGYIFDTGIIDILMSYFWSPPQYRIDCIRCFTEITQLQQIPAQFAEKLGMHLWVPLMQKLSQISPMTLRYSEDQGLPQYRLYWEAFYSQITVCLTSLLKNYRTTVCEIYPDPEQGVNLTIFAFDFLNNVTSKFAHEETFKVCVDYWNSLSEALLTEVRMAHKASQALNTFNRPSQQPYLMLNSDQTTTTPAMTTDDSSDDSPLPLENPELYSEKLRLYQPTLTALRKSLIMKMARPQEVCICYDEETGTVSKTHEIDTDEVALYNNMRDTLVYLTNLGGKEMQTVMSDLLKSLTDDARNPNQKSWNPTILNRLCWALGSISGAMSLARERSFLVHVIRELLWLCEHKRGKENKAIVASMIMYVFGQYPRFLKSFVRFLETVISKIFEFMLETFPGVQEMACESFLKIAQQCAKAIATSQDQQNLKPPIIEDLIPQLAEYYSQLQTPNKQLMLYEGIGHIIAAANTLQEQEEYISKVCAPFSMKWTEIMLELASRSATAPSDPTQKMFQPHIARKVTEIIRIYDRIACTTGAAFSKQLSSIHQEMLQLYSLYSKQLSDSILTHGVTVLSHHEMKTSRSVKRATVLLLKSYVEAAISRDGGASKNAIVPDANFQLQIAQFIIPPVLSPILEIYRSDLPQARDSETLSLLTALVANLSQYIAHEIPRIFDLVFECSLDMIKSDFHSYPDHRSEFYSFLKACCTFCFDAIFSLPETYQKYIMESVLWAIRHEHPQIAEQGLTILQIILNKISASEPTRFAMFCRSFYWSLLHDIIGVLTDTLHKGGYRLQVLLLMYLIQFVELGKLDTCQITKPLVVTSLCETIMRGFQNLTAKQVEVFVLDLFNKSGDPKEFAQHIKNFLISLKEFAGSEEMFEAAHQAALERTLALEKERRMQVPGLVPQYIPAERIRLDELD